MNNEKLFLVDGTLTTLEQLMERRQALDDAIQALLELREVTHSQATPESEPIPPCGCEDRNCESVRVN